MSASVKTLIDRTNLALSDVGCALTIAQLSGVYKAAGFLNCVPCCACLPSASLNTGRLFWIADCKIYRYSDGSQWTKDFSLPDSRLWVWGGGDNYTGSIGDGSHSVCRCSPVREFCSAIDWLAGSISGKYQHTAAMKQNGSIWSWGQNPYGQLGNGSSTSFPNGICSPVREVSSATNWYVVDTGRHNTSAIKTDGTLWSWGWRILGLTADGTTSSANATSPIQEFCSATNWCSLSRGGTHGLAIKTDGSLWTWGRNVESQLGIGLGCAQVESTCTPVREICSATNWSVAIGGQYSSAAIKTDGSLWMWGKGTCGVLGNGNSVDSCAPLREFCSSNDWSQMSTWSCTSAGIKRDGSLWTWGYNYFGGLGVGNTVAVCSPIREVCSATNWCKVSSSGASMAAIKTDNTLWAWGWNGKGQLARGNVTDSCSPVQEICSATNWFSVSMSALGRVVGSRIY